MNKIINFFLIALVTKLVMTSTVSAQEATPRLWPVGRQLTITQARTAQLAITNTNNGQQFSRVFYLGPAAWEWRSSDGNTIETWKVTDTDWLDSYDPYIGRPVVQLEPTVLGGPYTIVQYNTAPVGGLFNSERFTALLPPNRAENSRNYVVVSGGVYGSLLFPYWAGAPDCQDSEYCYATQEGGLRSLPLQWTATVTINE